jgi:hypothetical protein
MKIFQIIFCLFFATNALAQSLDQGAINSVVQEIVVGSGPVTKAEYDKFWGQFGATTAADRGQFINLMKQKFILAQEYQREVWICAEQAWNSRAVPACLGAKNKLALLTAEMKKNDAESALTPMSDYSTKLLAASAARGSIQNPNGGGEVALSLEMIKSTREGLDKMLARLGQVLRPNY